MAVNVPSFLPEPFANEGQRATIPDTPSSEQGRASWQLGFPQVCAQPLASGGIPPNYLDFQGIFNALSSSICYMQTGALWPWSSTLTYPLGAHVLGSDNNEYVAVQENTGQDPTQDDGKKWKTVTSFIGTGFLPLTGGTMTGPLRFNVPGTEYFIGTISGANNQYGKRLLLDTAEEGDLGASLELRKGSDTQLPGGFLLVARNANGSAIKPLVGTVDGSLRWDGKQIVRSVNGVTADSTGNVSTMPVGSVYVQFANQPDPTSLFGGTWSNISSSFAGLFFRAEGGAAAAFGGSQSGGLPGITGAAELSSSTIGTSVRDASGAFYATGNYSRGTVGSSMFESQSNLGINAKNSSNLYGAATEVRPVNSTIRIWKRTA